MPYESDPIARKLNDLVSNHGLYMDLMSFGEMNAAEQALVGTWELVNEVYNGGFVQYFCNSSRANAKPMVGVLRSIDAQRAASTLESALALAGPDTRWTHEPNFVKAKKSIPSDVGDRLVKLEREFYDELDHLHGQVFKYLSEHRNEIDIPADFWTESRKP
jgi:hypothetical protein